MAPPHLRGFASSLIKIAFSAMTPVPYLPPEVAGRCWRRAQRRIRDTTPRSHVELVALFAISGRMVYLIDGQVLTLGPGALLWAHTDQSHVLLSESADFDMWVLVMAPWVLTPERLFPPRLAASTQAAAEARLLDEAAASELRAVAAGLSQTDDSALLEAGLRWWAARAWTAWRGAETTSGRRIHAAVRRAADLLRADPEMPLGVLAARAGLSLSRLGRLFRAETGVGLGAFRTERRLERVDAIMASSTAPSLLTAALDGGFGSYSQFYRVFASARGAKPRDYYSLGRARRT